MCVVRQAFDACEDQMKGQDGDSRIQAGMNQAYLHYLAESFCRPDRNPTAHHLG